MSVTEPSPQEVLGHEPAHVAIDPLPVTVEGTIRAQLVGSQIGVSRSIVVSTVAEIVLANDPRRRRAVFLAAAAVRLGSRSDVDQDSAFLLPANVPVEHNHVDEIWCRADTGTARLSILVEDWTN